MGSYLDLLIKVGPTPQELAEKQKQMEKIAAEKEKAIKEGAKEEIAHAQGRIKELREDPSKTYNRPYDPEFNQDCCGEHVQKFKKVKDPKEEFRCAVNDLAMQIMENAEDESEAIKGYTDQINKTHVLQFLCVDAIEHLTKKLAIPEGPELKPHKATPTEIQAKLDYYQKIYDWTVKNIIATREKIQDELNHNSALLSEYIEFTGIKPNPDGIREVAKTIGTAAPAPRT